MTHIIFSDSVNQAELIPVLAAGSSPSRAQITPNRKRGVCGTDGCRMWTSGIRTSTIRKNTRRAASDSWLLFGSEGRGLSEKHALRIAFSAGCGCQAVPWPAQCRAIKPPNSFPIHVSCVILCFIGGGSRKPKADMAHAAADRPSALPPGPEYSAKQDY